MATKVYVEEEVELQDGTVLNLRPLNIKNLRKFMKVVKEMQPEEGKEIDEFEGLDKMVDACQVAISQFDEELAADREKLEEALDAPTIEKIFEVAGGIKVSQDPNLMSSLDRAGTS